MLKYEMLSMLKMLQKENPVALSDEKLFKAFSRDLFKNDASYNACIRWICIALFEHSATFLLEQGVANGDILIMHRLVSKLIVEGAQPNIAAETVGYLAALTGYEDAKIAGFIKNKSYSAESMLRSRNVIIGSIEWCTLEEKNNMSLLLSEKIVERRAFHETSAETDWGTCTLGNYLNNDFCDKFCDIEKEYIVSREIITDKNPWFNTTSSNVSRNRIFLLSLEDVVKYFGDSGQLQSLPAKKLFIDDKDYNDQRIARDDNGQPIIWWLRSPGDSNRSAAVVMGNGCINPCGFDVSNPQGGVRPAMWVNNIINT
jgi:hypothetical protein